MSTAAPDKQLQSDCHKLCDDFPDLFKNELGCLKDFGLEKKFKSNAKPVFCKQRPVPFAIRDDYQRDMMTAWPKESGNPTVQRLWHSSCSQPQSATSWATQAKDPDLWGLLNRDQRSTKKCISNPFLFRRTLCKSWEEDTATQR